MVWAGSVGSVDSVGRAGRAGKGKSRRDMQGSLDAIW